MVAEQEPADDEHGMVWSIQGDPGSGKTQYLSSQVDRAVKKYGSDNVIVASFTRAAAVEIASRIQTDRVALPRQNVNTLHSHAYRAIGGMDLADANLDMWNALYPHYTITGGTKPEDSIDLTYGKSTGDVIYGEYQILRNKMIPQSDWPDQIVDFHTKWQRWKDEIGYVDFTDMIEIAYNTIDVAPGNPTIGVFDEFQDFTPLQCALVDKWARHMKAVIIAGDPNQVLYRFTGASPDYLIEKSKDPDHHRALPRSYRIPQAVQQYSVSWIQRASQFIKPEYKPRDEVGWIRNLRRTFDDPIDIVKDMQQYEGKSIMVMASCGYMIDGIRDQLRKAGLPFHNPYRRTRGDWNPLRVGKGMSGSDRVMSFLRYSTEVHGDQARMWTGKELYAFSSVIEAKGVILRGAKQKIALNKDSDVPYDVLDLMSYFEPHVLDPLTNCDLDWFKSVLLDRAKPTLGYVFKIIDERGISELSKIPNIMLGTIHSFKGGEADIVYVFPDLSWNGFMVWNGRDEQRDEIIRLFYVAFTRAREGVVLCNPATNKSVKFPKA
jgi:DNA helicase-2/ATP-dependent DNA helicase PcrA